MTVRITRFDYDATGLRFEASRTRDGKASRRMLALALELEGASRAQAARLCGMDGQTLRDWVRRYNEEGLQGLYDRPSSGRPPCLMPEQEGELARLVETGPDRTKDGVVRWRRADLKRVIGERFGVSIHERTVGKLLDRLGFSRLSVRPQHPEQDPQAQEQFKKTSRGS